MVRLGEARYRTFDTRQDSAQALDAHALDIPQPFRDVQSDLIDGRLGDVEIPSGAFRFCVRSTLLFHRHPCCDAGAHAEHRNHARDAVGHADASTLTLHLFRIKFGLLDALDRRREIEGSVQEGLVGFGRAGRVGPERPEIDPQRLFLEPASEAWRQAVSLRSR